MSAAIQRPNRPELRYHLTSDCSIQLDGEGAVQITGAAARLSLKQLSPTQVGVITALSGRGATEKELCAQALTDGPAALPWVFFILTQLGRRYLLETTLMTDGAQFATVQPLSRSYQPAEHRPTPSTGLQLCRFAYLRQREGKMLLESPRALVSIVLHDWRGPALLALSSAGVAAALEPTPDLPISGETARAFVDLLFQHGFLSSESAQPDDEDADALRQWEFHDLLFHSRSRAGRHRNPWGATYLWKGVSQPLPAVKEMDGVVTPLHRPNLADLKATDPSFSSVLESRRSLRIPGEQPLTVAQLSEFLFRCCRVRARAQTENEEVSNRPYPGGGADYELEIYPIVNRVAGLEKGVYYYHPLQHCLMKVAEDGPGPAALLREAAQKARAASSPDVLVCITARIQRLTYKYSSIAYAILLKDLGVLYQTFYLNATAMGLAPCAIGGGDADLFQSVTRLSYYREPYVGEFMLSSRNAAEAAPVLPESDR